MTVTSSTIKALLASAVLASLAACSNGGGGGGGKAPGTGAANQPPEAVKPNAVGSFAETKSGVLDKYGRPSADLELPVRKQCEGVSDKDKSKTGFDSRLSVGHKFRETMAEAGPDSSFSMTRQALTKSVSETKGSFDIEITDFKMSPNPGGGTVLDMHAVETCEFNRETNTSSCTSDYAHESSPNAPSETVESETTSCFARSELPESTGTASLGTYTLASGAKVTAQKIERTSKVHVICQKGIEAQQDLGEGTEISIDIVSADVVEQRFISCWTAGTKIYSYRVLMTKDGRTMSSSKTEMLEAPIVK